MAKGKPLRNGVTLSKTARTGASAAKAGASGRTMKARQQTRPNERARREAEIQTAGNGTPWMFIAGWLVTVAGAVGLGEVVGPRWAAAIGDGFTYVVAPSPAGTPTWPAGIAVAGPLLGFNLIYFGHAPRHRRPAMLVFVAVVGAELLSLVVAAVWMVGAGLRASGLVGGGNAFDPLLFVLLCTGAAAAIMAWLGGNSTFERQRERYFATRRATVEVVPIGLPARLCWALGGSALVAVLVIGPARLAVDHLHDRYSSAPQRAWPQPWVADSGFATAVGLLSIVFGSVLGVCVFTLIKAVLYRTVLSATAARSSGRRARSFGLRTLRFVHHWPIAVAGMWWSYWLSWGVAENDVGNIDGGIGVPLWLGLSPLAIGLLLVSQVWRAQDQTGAARPMRLQMGGHCALTADGDLACGPGDRGAGHAVGRAAACLRRTN